MRVLIIGCGVVGTAAGQLLAAAGHQVLGIRRSPDGSDPGFLLYAGDAADADLYPRLGAADAVLFAANPGVRRGRDNGLLASARLIVARYPSARIVYTGTTSLYGDAAGGAVDEQAPLEATPEAAALAAIEQPFATHANALVLRATALVGPTRTFTRERIVAAAGGELMVKGDLDRPFSWLHEADLSELCLHALFGGLGCGVLNAAAPQHTTVRGYYEALGAAAGVTVTLRSDGAELPSRRIDASRLHRLLPTFPWRDLND